MAIGRRRKQLQFPFKVEKNGRTGTIYKLANGTFKSYFRHAGEARQNTHATAEAALLHLDEAFSTLDTDRENTLALHPLDSSIKTYREVEQLLKTHADGASLRDAVNFYIAHHKTKKLHPKTVSECSDAYVASQKADNASPSHTTNLEKHFRRFNKDFGDSKIHLLTSLVVSTWLASQTDEKTGKSWSVKTRTSVLGSLVSLSLFSRDILNALPDVKTEFQKVRRPKKDHREAVEIYTPDEMEKLLLAALENDIFFIPPLIVGAFQGLRPAEFHAENAKRPPLKWDAFIWSDKILHITGQKIRSKANRDIPLHQPTINWLKPFKHLKGEMWRFRQSYTKKMILIRDKAKVRSIYDGLRHSYASYRIRILKGNLPELAQEMGNSEREIINSYKRNVTDAEAEAWFSIAPPSDYAEKIKAALKLRSAI